MDAKRGIAVLLVVIAMFLAAYAYFVLAYPPAEEDRQACSFLSISYNSTQPETVRQCYETRLLYSLRASFDEEEIEGRSKRDYNVYFTLKNEDTAPGIFKFRSYYDNLDCDDEDRYDWVYNNRGEKEYKYMHCKEAIMSIEEVYLMPGEEQTFYYHAPLSRHAFMDEYEPQVLAPTKQVCRDVVINKKIVSYRQQEICN